MNKVPSVIRVAGCQLSVASFHSCSKWTIHFITFFQTQIFFSKLEDFQRNKTAVLKDLKQFIGPSADEMSEHTNFKAKNKGALKRMIHNKTIEMLDKFYAPHNRALADLLGDDKWLFEREDVWELFFLT